MLGRLYPASPRNLGRFPWQGREEAYESIRFRLRLLAPTLQLSHHGKRKTSPQRSGRSYRHLCRLPGLWQGVSLRLDENEDGPLRAGQFGSFQPNHRRIGQEGGVVAGANQLLCTHGEQFVRKLEGRSFERPFVIVVGAHHFRGISSLWPDRQFTSLRLPAYPVCRSPKRHQPVLFRIGPP